jgi:hypothetical protein
LEKVGFVWDKSDAYWDEMYSNLCSFKSKYGHCRVPHHRGGDSSFPPEEFKGLGTWVQRQRQGKKGKGKMALKCRLTQDRIGRLDKLGFVWNVRESFWDEQFEELKRFHKENGHCVIPTTKTNATLKMWCHHQRQLRKEGNLTVDRQEKLDSVGFNWIVHAYKRRGRFVTNGKVKKKTSDLLQNKAEQQWIESVNRLVDFKATHGHWRVPPSYKIDTSLSKWIETQRENRDTMKPEGVEKLNSIGFPWTATTVDEDHCAEADDKGDESDVECDKTDEEHCAEANDEGNESNVEYDTAN